MKCVASVVVTKESLRLVKQMDDDFIYRELMNKVIVEIPEEYKYLTTVLEATKLVNLGKLFDLTLKKIDPLRYNDIEYITLPKAEKIIYHTSKLIN